ncbi:OPT superfamily oligopeptide transporter, partial [Pseudomonas syringae pv. pisi str. 1704B]
RSDIQVTALPIYAGTQRRANVPGGSSLWVMRGHSVRDYRLVSEFLAFVLPASVSLMMALGAVLTWLVNCRWPSLTERFAITAAAGLIAGESITGVGASLWQMVQNGG